MYRGYDIAGLAEHASYEEVAYLLLEGDLPTETSSKRSRSSSRRRGSCPGGDDDHRRQRDGRLADGDAAHRRLGALLLRPAEDAIDRENELRKAVTLIAQLPTIVARYEPPPRRAGGRSGSVARPCRELPDDAARRGADAAEARASRSR